MGFKGVVLEDDVALKDGVVLSLEAKGEVMALDCVCLLGSCKDD